MWTKREIFRASALSEQNSRAMHFGGEDFVAAVERKGCGAVDDDIHAFHRATDCANVADVADQRLDL